MNVFDSLRLLSVGWRDIVEIVIVAIVLYRLMLAIHGTRAVQMLVGVALVAIAYAAAWMLELTMITYLLGLVFTYGAFAALIIFQPELRQALAQLGQSPVSRIMRRLADSEVADEIGEAVERLSRSATGAIIAIERDVPLSDYLQSGSEMQARVSADLLQTIFTPYSPLHDGAVIVRGDAIVGAGCILPLSQRPLTDRALGTRHRAALGVSEETDAIVVIVSEETATISVAIGGQLTRGVTPTGLRDLLAGKPTRASVTDTLAELGA